MSNYPIGENSQAPYNINDISFKFDVEVEGLFYFSYYGDLDQEEAKKALLDKIKDALKVCPDMDINSIKANFK